MEKIEGDFECALHNLIQELTLLKGGKSVKSIDSILYDWDKTRGNDWFSSTKLSDQKADLLEVARLKWIYEGVEE